VFAIVNYFEFFKTPSVKTGGVFLFKHSNKIMGNLIKPSIYKPKLLSLRDFHEKRNKILIWHDKGGLGDVLMQRMIFADFKKTCPEADLIFACLPEYMDAVKDHPCISEVIDSRKVNISDYINHYNTCVSIADRYEHLNAPFCLDHRADIWAKYCGVNLTKHDMQFRFDSVQVEDCRNKLKQYNSDKPIVLFSPISKMATKTLLPFQIQAVVDATKDYNLIGIHNKEIKELTNLGIPSIYGTTIKEWMLNIAASDYVISVDTSTFHMAGGLSKPLVGIFTFADGDAYGKYYPNMELIQLHRKNGNWDCGPCFKFANCYKSNKAQKPCLTEISPEMIKDGIHRLFKRFPFK
jgi:ADP-heptose:LPS heptosyltransferase